MIDSFKGLFLEQIKDLYHAEKQLSHALPRTGVAASSEDLKDALERHVTRKREHVARLERIFELVGEHPAERRCRAMQGLVSETDEMLRECSVPEVRDAAIVACAQRIQHYEIAGYGTARTYARIMGEDDAAQLLQSTLDEEARLDRVLTDLAESTVNRQAVAV